MITCSLCQCHVFNILKFIFSVHTRLCAYSLCMWRSGDNVVELERFLSLRHFRGLNLGCQATAPAFHAEPSLTGSWESHPFCGGGSSLGEASRCSSPAGCQAFSADLLVTFSPSHCVEDKEGQESTF